jgi:hypothetical protein
MTDIADTILEHIEDLNNPHQLTKDDIGLGLVNNFTIATNAEAFAGTVADRFVTPALLREVFKGILTRRRMLNTTGLAILQ